MSKTARSKGGQPSKQEVASWEEQLYEADGIAAVLFEKPTKAIGKTLYLVVYTDCPFQEAQWQTYKELTEPMRASVEAFELDYPLVPRSDRKYHLRVATPYVKAFIQELVNAGCEWKQVGHNLAPRDWAIERTRYLSCYKVFLNRLQTQLEEADVMRKRVKPASPAAASTKPARPAAASTKPASPAAASTEPAKPAAASTEPAKPAAASTEPAKPAAASTKRASRSAASPKRARRAVASTNVEADEGLPDLVADSDEEDETPPAPQPTGRPRPRPTIEAVRPQGWSDAEMDEWIVFVCKDYHLGPRSAALENEIIPALSPATLMERDRVIPYRIYSNEEKFAAELRKTFGPEKDDNSPEYVIVDTIDRGQTTSALIDATLETHNPFDPKRDVATLRKRIAESGEKVDVSKLTDPYRKQDPIDDESHPLWIATQATDKRLRKALGYNTEWIPGDVNLLASGFPVADPTNEDAGAHDVGASNQMVHVDSLAPKTAKPGEFQPESVFGIQALHTSRVILYRRSAAVYDRVFEEMEQVIPMPETKVNGKRVPEYKWIQFCVCKELRKKDMPHIKPKVLLLLSGQIALFSHKIFHAGYAFKRNIFPTLEACQDPTETTLVRFRDAEGRRTHMRVTLRVHFYLFPFQIKDGTAERLDPRKNTVDVQSESNIGLGAMLLYTKLHPKGSPLRGAREREMRARQAEKAATDKRKSRK